MACDCNCKCCRSKFLVIFFEQLFDISNSAGSLIVEAINLFRIFQKLSSTKRFATRFSSSCLRMFQWAKDFFHIIVNSLFRMRPFTDYESFSLYIFVFPLVIMTYITFINHTEEDLKAIVFFWMYLIIAAFGLGLSYIGKNNIIAIVLSLAAILYFIVSILIIRCCTKKQRISENLDSEEEKYKQKNQWQTEEYLRSLISTRSVYMTCNLFLLLMIPYALCRFKLQIFIIVICALIILLSFIFENIFEGAVTVKMTNFLINILTLLIIPQTEKFVEIMQGEYHNKWNLILGYVVNSLLIPIVIIIIMIIDQYSEITDKYKVKSKKQNKNDNESYKEFNFYTLIEIVDIVRQIVFAIVSAYDIIWASIGIEIGWFILIVALRPYENISEYFISAGSSVIVIVTNAVVLYYDSNSSEIFSLAASIVIIVFACIPPVLAIIIYFICDFEKEFKDYDDSEEFCSFICKRHQPNEEDEIKAVKIINIGIYVCPILYLTYGIHLSILFDQYDFASYM